MKNKIEDINTKIIEEEGKLKRENSTSSICNQNDHTDISKELDKCKNLVNQNKEMLKTEIINSNKKKAGKKDKKDKTLLMLVSNTKYHVIKHVGKKVFKFKLTKHDTNDWDLCWQDEGVMPETLCKMKPYQKINHFPGMFALSRKNNLGRNLMKMRKIFSQEYNFFPKTWLLPSEWTDILNYNSKAKNPTYIVKPEASSQGRGIFLCKGVEEIKQGEHYVVQKYMKRPLLIEGLKFDLRIYVLLYGCSPMRIFIYNKGLSRFCTEKYEKPNNHNLKNSYIHLTNYAINKNSKKFVFNKDATDCTTGHKRNLDCIYKFVDENGGNSNTLKAKIEDAVIKTIAAVQPSLAHIYTSCQTDDVDGGCCFEILGFDFLLNKRFKPYLLEVNHSPSFTTDTPFDWKVKKELISDTIRLLNITQKKKNKFIQSRKIDLQKRIFTSKKVKYSSEGKAKEKEKRFKERVNYENKNLGGYKLIYPLDNSEKYDKYILEAKKIYDSFSSVKKPQKDSKESSIIKQMPPNSRLTVHRTPNIKNGLNETYKRKTNSQAQKRKVNNKLTNSNIQNSNGFWADNSGGNRKVNYYNEDQSLPLTNKEKISCASKLKNFEKIGVSSNLDNILKLPDVKKIPNQADYISSIPVSINSIEFMSVNNQKIKPLNSGKNTFGINWLRKSSSNSLKMKIKNKQEDPIIHINA